MLHIVRHKAPNLGRAPLMSSEATIIDRKLALYPATLACWSTPNFTLICGAPGTGKTSLVIRLLKTIYKKTFHDIYACIPEVSLDSIPKSDDVFRKHLDDRHLFHEFNEDTMNEIYTQLVENAKDDYNSLLIIDDFGTQLKEGGAGAMLNKIIIKMRHLKTTVFVLCQNYYQLGKQLREIATNMILFPSSKSMNEKIFDELFDWSKPKFQQVMDTLEDRHDWLLLNLRNKRMFNHNFHELVFSDDTKYSSDNDGTGDEETPKTKKKEALTKSRV